MGRNFFNVAEALSLSALTPLLRTERGSILLYTFRGAEQPSLMHEVGRLRERAFRGAGGGTGCEVDVDADDLSPEGYNQLIAWDMRREEIVGGYRYIVCRDSSPSHISTLHYFRPSLDFFADYLPCAIEVGRSFVISHSDVHPLFAMEALWQGLGRIVSGVGVVRYMFGKVTLYPDYDAQARRLLLLFLKKFFPPAEPLLVARKPAVEQMGEDPFTMEYFDDNYTLLRRLLRRLGERVPPMISAYMRLSHRLQFFDTILNPDFGNAYETAMLLPVDDLLGTTRERYLY